MIPVEKAIRSMVGVMSTHENIKQIYGLRKIKILITQKDNL